MPYQEASRKLSAADRQVIAQVLRAWKRDAVTTAQLARNFVREEQLDLLTHEAFLRQLSIRWAPSPTVVVFSLNVYVEECNNFFLRGPLVGGIEVKLVGRAAAYRGFKGYLEKALARLGVPLSAGALDTELRALAANCAAEPALAATFTRAFFRGVPIAGNPTWCAFVNPNRTSTPFVPPCNTAEQICETLGLGMIDPPEELALFTYTPNKALRTPSIADAGVYHFYRPSPVASEHGWTEPLRRYVPHGISQPEAVHERLHGDAPQLSFSTML